MKGLTVPIIVLLIAYLSSAVSLIK